MSEPKTPSEINIAIAELCGYKKHSVEKSHPFYCTVCGTQYSRSIWREWEVANQWCGNEPPDYHSSLDACAEFERTLTKQEAHEYHDRILELVREEGPSLTDIHEGRGNPASRWTWHAAAPQRCAAFLAVKQPALKSNE